MGIPTACHVHPPAPQQAAYWQPRVPRTSNRQQRRAARAYAWTAYAYNGPLQCGDSSFGLHTQGTENLRQEALRINSQQRRSRVIAKATKADAPTASDVKPGCLVEYDKDGKATLALVHSPDGKKNWWLVAPGGRRVSVQPKQLALILPGAGHTEATLSEIYAAAQSENLDVSLLEIAWEIAADGGTALSLYELSDLLFEDTSARTQYITHRMLAECPLFFKQASKVPASYEPRPADAVAEGKRKADEAAALKAELGGWLSLVKAARSGKAKGADPLVWLQGPYAKRIEAIKALALNAPPPSGSATGAPPPLLEPSIKSLAVDSLKSTGVNKNDPSPDDAAELLIELGVWRMHEQLSLLRRGLAVAWDDRAVARSQAGQAGQAYGPCLGHDEGGFSAQLCADAQALVDAPPPDLDASSRMDLTHLRVYTIDDESTTEVDDGLSVEQLPDGTIRLWVHVADPTRWLAPGSALDLEARARIRTLYYPHAMRPMFPANLSTGIFSLREGQECCALSVSASLGPSGRLTDPRVTPSRLRVTHRLTYDSADAAISSGEAACPLPDLLLLRDASALRRMHREARGAIEIPLPEANVHVSASQLDMRRPAVAVTRISQWESISRSLVAEMMIMAGEALGVIGMEASLPLPYRGQETPTLPAASILDALPEGPCRGYALKRCMTRSMVSSEPTPHASLALDAYVQVTSPIRRYADLVAHWQIKAWRRRHVEQGSQASSAGSASSLPFSKQQIDDIMSLQGERAREFNVAEREAEQYWVAEYLSQRKDATWGATMLGWFRQDIRLAAVLIDDLGMEVVTRVEARLVPGDTLVVGISELDPSRGHYRFTTVGYTSVTADIGSGTAEDADEVQDEGAEEEDEGKAEEDEQADVELEGAGVGASLEAEREQPTAAAAV